MIGTVFEFTETNWEWAWRRRKYFTTAWKDMLGGLAGGIVAFLMSAEFGPPANTQRSSVIGIVASVIAAATLPIFETMILWSRATSVRLREENDDLRRQLAETTASVRQQKAFPPVEILTRTSGDRPHLMELSLNIASAQVGRTFVILPDVIVTNQSSDKLSVMLRLELELQSKPIEVVETYDGHEAMLVLGRHPELAGSLSQILATRLLQNPINLARGHSVGGALSFWFQSSLRQNVIDRIGACPCTYNLVVQDLVSGKSKTVAVHKTVVTAVGGHDVL